DINQVWQRIGYRGIETLDRDLPGSKSSEGQKIPLWIKKATLLNFEGEAREAYKVLEETRSHVEANDDLAAEWLYTVIYFQGVTALRRGENENCILCRGESSCILPISPAAVHTNPEGSRRAITHFTEYLEQFPDDLEIRWLLNLAHMTLGEYPQQVDPRYLVSLDHWLNCEFDIGKFRDIGERAGVNRLNQSGGAIMEDFDNDGLLDIVVTTLDPTQTMAFYRNKGDGTFEDRTSAAGLSDQLGGLYCVQTDYNNDGHMDIFIARGAWYPYPIRPSLLRNNGNGTFTDVTREAGLLDPVNSNCAAWADFDNDGYLDLFICCEQQPNRLYRNRGDGTFEEVAAKAGVQGHAGDRCKGCAWIDYDNDGYPDLFVNNMGGTAHLYHNNGDGTFTDVTPGMGIDGPRGGFSCWAFDYDNDGWLDIFATSYKRTLAAVVKGLQGQPHDCATSKLYRNLHGKGFQDVTHEAGLDMCFATMGSNFGDFDNDGYLDFYLGTGDPNVAMLVPNRMFKNVAGKRFAEITASSGTGHLQKGHAVACGDWDRDGNIDIFIQMGGATNGDKYHNILFQNPGHANHWLTVKLIGKKTNRPAIGARIKVVTAGAAPSTIHRLVSSGSSFGANPLQQTIGLGQAAQVASLEITWPTSRTTQVFYDVPVDQAIEITEFAAAYRPLHWTKVPMAPLKPAPPRL
ncbi:MAG TPA: CRTAC1 family protein, partial [Gemmataceae bacterium]|nr:CRTAC1 family protein [Gemmataceae bacterium]